MTRSTRFGLDKERSVKDGFLKGLLRGLDRWHSDFDCIGKNKKHHFQAKPLFGSSPDAEIERSLYVFDLPSTDSGNLSHLFYRRYLLIAASQKTAKS